MRGSKRTSLASRRLVAPRKAAEARPEFGASPVRAVAGTQVAAARPPPAPATVAAAVVRPVPAALRRRPVHGPPPSRAVEIAVPVARRASFGSDSGSSRDSNSDNDTDDSDEQRAPRAVSPPFVRPRNDINHALRRGLLRQVQQEVVARLAAAADPREFFNSVQYLAAHEWYVRAGRSDCQVPLNDPVHERGALRFGSPFSLRREQVGMVYERIMGWPSPSPSPSEPHLPRSGSTSRLPAGRPSSTSTISPSPPPSTSKTQKAKEPAHRLNSPSMAPLPRAQLSSSSRGKAKQCSVVCCSESDLDSDGRPPSWDSHPHEVILVPRNSGGYFALLQQGNHCYRIVLPASVDTVGNIEETVRGVASLHNDSVRKKLTASRLIKRAGQLISFLRALEDGNVVRDSEDCERCRANGLKCLRRSSPGRTGYGDQNCFPFFANQSESCSRTRRAIEVAKKEVSERELIARLQADVGAALRGLVSKEVGLSAWNEVCIHLGITSKDLRRYNRWLGELDKLLDHASALRRIFRKRRRDEEEDDDEDEGVDDVEEAEDEDEDDVVHVHEEDFKRRSRRRRR